ncbi:MAG: selenide, water dikinase SelD, partial [Myxococcaceae bacterium]
AHVLRHLKHLPKHPDALVGYETSDDAAVYRLSKTLAVVETVDFFPPVVDDPYLFGQIAAANALSDIWAMGAKPLFALNLVGFPQGLPLRVLTRILAGGQSKAAEAGIPVLGGHSIQDNEPKYGMAVTGLVHPGRILTNAGARVGDVLLLTKPLGSGIATTAIKRKLASKELIRRVVRVMTGLNKAAGEVFASGKLTVHALTDVTGFGLLGHLLEMMVGARTRARLFLERVPIIEGVPELAAREIIPGGTRANLASAAKRVRFPKGLPVAVQFVLADAQTNGGLLASVPAKQAGKAMAMLSRVGVDAALIGEVGAGRAGVEVV